MGLTVMGAVEWRDVLLSRRRRAKLRHGSSGLFLRDEQEMEGSYHSPAGSRRIEYHYASCVVETVSDGVRHGFDTGRIVA